MATVFKAKHPRNIPVAYYKPIGQLIVRWGFTELYLQSIVAHLAHQRSKSRPSAYLGPTGRLKGGAIRVSVPELADRSERTGGVEGDR
jgi:hypothetical protein